ncbi:hypothetical protein [Pseudomonas sp. C2B4]|uniref:hypothetical protein n=1 Tax=Pseudomonas sp. C2B4 TaxID=2735270 RepID=UPI001586A513|nr:hypothetical protein [Pseudomonas sp. C2B4]NUU38280.1 hypothetical protein [Pseudomonas sp. C2B4]
MKTTYNWQNTDLLRAQVKVITTPTKSNIETSCNGVDLRYNIGNIHEIKKSWNIPTKN